jgi:hypothetical protein
MEIVVAGKPSGVADALLNPAQIKQLEPLIERIVGRVVARPRRLKTIREFADANALGLTLAYEELNSGRLEAVKVGTKTLVTPEAEAAWRARLPRYKPADAMDELKSKPAITTNELESA